MTRQMVMVGFLQAQNRTNLPSSWRHPQSRDDSMSQCRRIIIRRSAEFRNSENPHGVFRRPAGNAEPLRQRSRPRPRTVARKDADTFKPLGPWVKTSVDLDTMETIVRVNGNQSNRIQTNDMIFGIKPFIVELT